MSLKKGPQFFCRASLLAQLSGLLRLMLALLVLLCSLGQFWLCSVVCFLLCSVGHVMEQLSLCRLSYEASTCRFSLQSAGRKKWFNNPRSVSIQVWLLAWKERVKFTWLCYSMEWMTAGKLPPRNRSAVCSCSSGAATGQRPGCPRAADSCEAERAEEDKAK